MDYSKVDAALAAALSEPTGSPGLAISVRTLGPLDPSQKAELRKLGAQGVEASRNIFSATVSPKAVAKLTDKPWVRRLSLARQLRAVS